MNRKTILPIATLLFLLAPLGQGAFALSASATIRHQAGTPAVSRSDAQMTDDLADALGNYAFTEVYDWVEGSVDHGVASVAGFVVQPWHKEVLLARVRHIPGVRSVRDGIRVLPVSIFDDRLRVAARRALFGREFQQWSRLGNPPIHVVVDRGVVTLYGEVPSRVESTLAGSLVRTRTSALTVVNRLNVTSGRRG
ncbi:MAG TPA: BON domain-containing protein [Thermoanaerobaculia bacterium]|nr:BON domain-containing protein [Thermoanaerobaculia bacterium]